MELQDCLSSMTQGSNTKASLTEDYDVDFNHEDFTSCLFEGLNEKDQQASELLRMLNKELTEFIDLISKKDFQAMECRRKLLSCFFERIVGHAQPVFIKSFHYISHNRFLRTAIAPTHYANWRTCVHSCGRWIAIWISWMHRLPAAPRWLRTTLIYSSSMHCVAAYGTSTNATRSSIPDASVWKSSTEVRIQSYRY